MSPVSAWIFHHRASLDAMSPLNFDGSDFLVGVAIVPGSTIREALDNFDAYLSENKMEVIAIWKCEQYHPKKFSEPTEENRTIALISAEVLEQKKSFYAWSTSEHALDDSERDDNDFHLSSEYIYQS
ncbi:hypothetical protein O5O45_27930 [Hahella aquimaris]|uniref:hypothetical protein n=1 Tax=Hahella sp. HNIBRBA332 TaxID=3015983 RepID=UPI00273C7F14|nr:hypothetical protein [Hahella sp. HNIBRBA332]WLQ13561.1 hypothetical protein O5O45_27930 [Hahella sp. HNIBRBA332]